MSVTLFIMTYKGLSVLKALAKYDHLANIDLVVVGRDDQLQEDYSREIIQFCNRLLLKWVERTDPHIVNSEYIIAISWRWIIHTDKILIVLHDSLLPAYRGFASLVNALINREPKTGVTAIIGDDQYDSGDIIMQSEYFIIYPVKIKTAIEQISKNYEEIVLKLFEKIKANEPIIGNPQNPSDATYSLWRDRGDYLIDWSRPADEILQFIYATGFPYKCAATRINGEELIRITDAEIVEDVKIENRDCGKVIFQHGDHPVIVCGNGLLKILAAYSDQTKKNALPFLKFRSRLGTS